MIPADLRELAIARRWQQRDDGSRQGAASVEILCRRGLIFRHGPGKLAAWTESKRAWNGLLAVGCARLQTGDAEWSVIFPDSQLDAVADILKPRRARRLDPARARAIGRRTSFRRIEDAGAQSAFPAVGATQ
jgi:hypothetical protein